MRRREFITIVGGATAGLPLAALAQRQMPLVGFLNSASPDTYRFNADSFREGLTKAGFIEGRNVVLKNGGLGGIMAHCRPLRLNL
jgi:putative ABC transport system substrate-binding protein